MADHLPHVGDTAEHVAYRLLEMIIAKDPPKAPQSMNATWILSTYQRCLRAVRNPEPLKPTEPGRAK